MSKSRSISKIVTVCLIILLAACFAVLPEKLINGLLNQDFDDPDFASISTRETKLSLFLDSLHLEGITLTLKSSPENPVTIDEVEITGLARWPLFKAIFGFGDDLTKILGNGKVVVRSLSDHGPFGGMDRLRLGTMTISNFSLDLPQGSPPPRNLDYIKLGELRATDVDLASAMGQSFSADSLGVFNVSGSMVGGAVLSGLSANRGDFKIELDNASISGIRLAALSTAWWTTRPTTKALALLNSFQSLDLAAFKLDLAGEPALFLGKAIVDTAEASGSKPAARICDVGGLVIRLDALTAPELAPPAVKAILLALGKEITADLSIRGAAGGSSALRLDIKDKAMVNLALETQGVSSESLKGPIFLALPRISVKSGRLEILDKGLNKDLLPAIASVISRKRPAALAAASAPSLTGSLAPLAGIPLDGISTSGSLLAAKISTGDSAAQDRASQDDDSQDGDSQALSTQVVAAAGPAASGPREPLPTDPDDPLADSDIVAASSISASSDSQAASNGLADSGAAPSTEDSASASLGGQNLDNQPPDFQSQNAQSQAGQSPASESGAPAALAPLAAPDSAQETGASPSASSPEGPEAPDPRTVLLAGLQAFLAGWEDPDPNRAVLNSDILILEAGRYLDNPQILALRWEPDEPGFPQSVIDRVGGLPSILVELSKGRSDWSSLAAKYKYDIIQCLNVSLEVNNRAPVAVYLPPSENSAP